MYKLRDVRNLELAKFMHKIYNKKTSFSFQDKLPKSKKK